MNVLDKTKIRKYRSPELCVSAFWKSEGLSLSDLKKSIGVGYTNSGKKTDFNFTDMIEGMKITGMWGCCDYKTNMIYLWSDGKRSKKEMAMLIGHELGHILINSAKSRKHKISNKDVLEEMECDKYGIIASKVVELLEKYKLVKK